MIKLIKYDKTKTYYFPTGKLATPEVVATNYPASQDMTYVMQTDDNEMMLMSMDSLYMLRTIHNIDSALTEDEAIIAIQDILNTPQEISTEPTPEERTAAAVEAMAAGQTTENAAALDILLTGEDE